MADAEEELETLFRAEYRGLVRALAVVAGDAESAADAVQDAFVQAFKHWPRIRRYDQPVPWIRRTAVNRIMNQHRGRRRRDAAVDRLPHPVEGMARDLDIGPHSEHVLVPRPVLGAQETEAGRGPVWFSEGRRWPPGVGDAGEAPQPADIAGARPFRAQFGR